MVAIESCKNQAILQQIKYFLTNIDKWQNAKEKQITAISVQDYTGPQMDFWWMT